jgi:hypothetical protein
MKDKFFKFHFKNEKVDKVASYNIEFDNFSKAMEFAYDKLDKLNETENGYRIIGIYEIMTRLGN